MAENSTKPKIRFKEFSNDWEQSELGNIYQKIRNAFVGTATPYYVNDGHFYLESNNVKDGQINRNTEIFINDEFYEKQKDKWLKTGDLVMVQSGHVGHSAVIPLELNNTAAHALIIITNPIKKNNPYFFNYEFQTQKAKGNINNITTGNTIKHILSSEMKKFSIYTTKYEEQTKIADLLEDIDNLINLHQCKYEKLVNIKKAMLEKMFPKNSSKVPEIRFKGFTEDWNFHKLQEVATMKARIGWQGLTQKEFLDEGDYYLITGTDFDKGIIDFKNCHYIGEDRYNQDINIQIKNDDVLITKDGTIGKVAYVENMDKPATLNAGVFVIRGKNKDICNLYLYHYLAAPFLLDYADKQATGGTIKHLNQNVLVNFPIPMPKAEEQQKIGAFFKDLDGLIALHRSKYDKLINIKKAMLEKMFV